MEIDSLLTCSWIEEKMQQTEKTVNQVTLWYALILYFFTHCSHNLLPDRPIAMLPDWFKLPFRQMANQRHQTHLIHLVMVSPQKVAFRSRPWLQKVAFRSQAQWHLNQTYLKRGKSRCNVSIFCVSSDENSRSFDSLANLSWNFLVYIGPM